MDGSNFLSVEEAAVALRLSPITVYKHIKEGKIPCKKVGARILIPNSFFQSGTPETKSAPSPVQSDEQIRIATMRKSIEQHIQTLLASAPRDGKCAIELCMKEGCIMRVALKTEAALELN
jgi:excisionase family DNA binding protein